MHPIDLMHISERQLQDLRDDADHRRLARFARLARRRSSG